MRRRLLCCLFLLLPAAAPATRPSTQPAPQLDIPTPERPVTAAIRIEPDTPQPDTDLELHIFLRIAPGHWLYAQTNSKSPFTSVTSKVKSDPAVREAGSIDAPKADVHGHLTGDIQFTHRLHLSPDITPGKHSLTCQVTYQACNPDLCWPPQTILLKTEFELSAHQQN